MKLLLWIFIVVAPCVSLAQTYPTIRTGRPGQAIDPFVTGSGIFQIQSGIDISQSKSSINRNTVLSNTVVRHGFSESFEMSGVFNYQSDDLGPTTRDGVSDVQFGFRYNAIDKPNGLIPGLGIQTRFRLTSVSEEYKQQNVAPIFILVLQHKLSDIFSLINNFGLSYDGNTAEPTHSFITNLSFPVYGDWGGFIEVYGNETNGHSNHFVDGGFGYLVNDDLQLDISAGWGENHGATETFVSVGISWRAHLL